MARLILVRHGETEWNRQKRYQGQTDTELNTTGIRQAGKTAERLAQEKISVIYCSDLRRARQTAEIIASKQSERIDIRESPLLREMDFGDYEGLTFDEMDEQYRLIFSASPSWRSRGPYVRSPNGESIADLAARVEQFSTSTLEHHPSNDTVLIAAHGGTIQVLVCHLLGISLDHWWQIRISGAAVSILETYPQGTSIVLLNDVNHLKDRP